MMLKYIIYMMMPCSCTVLVLYIIIIENNTLCLLTLITTVIYTVLDLELFTDYRLPVLYPGMQYDSTTDW